MNDSYRCYEHAKHVYTYVYIVLNNINNMMSNNFLTYGRSHRSEVECGFVSAIRAHEVLRGAYTSRRSTNSTRGQIHANDNGIYTYPWGSRCIISCFIPFPFDGVRFIQSFISENMKQPYWKLNEYWYGKVSIHFPYISLIYQCPR